MTSNDEGDVFNEDAEMLQHLIIKYKLRDVPKTNLILQTK